MSEGPALPASRSAFVFAFVFPSDSLSSFFSKKDGDGNNKDEDVNNSSSNNHNDKNNRINDNDNNSDDINACY